jgi:hypothetical protein
VAASHHLNPYNTNDDEEAEGIINAVKTNRNEVCKEYRSAINKCPGNQIYQFIYSIIQVKLFNLINLLYWYVQLCPFELDYFAFFNFDVYSI